MYSDGRLFFFLFWVSSAVFSAHVVAEWLFFATKPSFMSALTRPGRFRVLFLSPLPGVLALGGAFLILYGAAKAFPSARKIAFGTGLLISSCLWAVLFLLLSDNFTYTLFGFSSLTEDGAWRLAYRAFPVILVVWGWHECRRAVFFLAGTRMGKGMAFCLGVAVVLWAGLLLRAERPAQRMEAVSPGQHGGELPHILLISSDGLSAAHLSLYGYERETTPFIERLSEDALVCENAFVNALNSGSSIASMLTGKAPTTLRLYYPPEILTGQDAYEHLPGILRGYGYETLDISMREFADAYDLNLREGFEEANGRREKRYGGGVRFFAGLEPNTAYFLEKCRDRITSRSAHLAGIRRYISAYEGVTGQKAQRDVLDDSPRIERLFRELRKDRARPLFAHMHLMGTHGPRFFPERSVFSRGLEQTEDFQDEFYDDAVLTFDGYVERIVDKMETENLLERSILVFCTDHGKIWKNERVPLLFRFPGGEHAGVLKNNAQNLDVAATLLDYLGIPEPEWLGGHSLISGEPPADRPVFCSVVNPRLVDNRSWLLDTSQLLAPFYSLGALSVIQRDWNASLDLVEETLSFQSIAGHSRPSGREPDTNAVHQLLLEHLAENGYPTGNLREPEILSIEESRPCPGQGEPSREAGAVPKIE